MRIGRREFLGDVSAIIVGAIAGICWNRWKLATAKPESPVRDHGPDRIYAMPGVETEGSEAYARGLRCPDDPVALWTDDAPNDGRWHHLMLSYDAAKVERKLYLDGRLIGGADAVAEEFERMDSEPCGPDGDYLDGWGGHVDELVEKLEEMGRAACEAGEKTEFLGDAWEASGMRVDGCGVSPNGTWPGGADLLDDAWTLKLDELRGTTLWWQDGELIVVRVEGGEVRVSRNGAELGLDTLLRLPADVEPSMTVSSPATTVESFPGGAARLFLPRYIDGGQGDTVVEVQGEWFNWFSVQPVLHEGIGTVMAGTKGPFQAAPLALRYERDGVWTAGAWAGGLDPCRITGSWDVTGWVRVHDHAHYG